MNWLFAPLVVLLGWSAGLLINYIADIFPRYRRFTWPACLVCTAEYPVLPYLFLQPCQCCGASRSARSWIVSILAVLLTLWVWLAPPRSGFLPGLALLTYFGIIIVIDIENRLILHSTSAAGAILGATYGTWMHGFLPTLLGGAAGFLSMLGLYLFGIVLIRVFRRYRGVSSGEALGFGDVTLSGVLGFVLGWPAILPGIFLAVLFAGLYSFAYVILAAILKRYSSNLSIPYGPFLVAGAIALLFFSAAIKSFLGQ